MGIKVQDLKFMLTLGFKNLVKQYKYIDELNIFPVPDGDTGSNMKSTFEGGINAIKDQNYENFFSLGRSFNRGLLMNARGNSGVITSQIFKGFFLGMTENKTELEIEDIVTAFANAKEIAYKAVIKPVEGTILTVIRIISETLNVNKTDYRDINSLFKNVIEIAEAALANTPNLLPELKEAGVVDSGGYGLCRILEGMYEALNELSGTKVSEQAKPTQVEEATPVQKELLEKEKQVEFKDNNEGFGYCNEFIMEIGTKVDSSQKNKSAFDLEYFRKKLSKMGNSLVVVQDDKIVKVHIHSTRPWPIFDFASNYGEFLKVKVENMTQQFLANNPSLSLEDLLQQQKNERFYSEATNAIKLAVTVPSKVSVSIFENDFNIRGIVNSETFGIPTTKTFLNLFKKVNSKNVVLLIDDSNFVLAAQQAIQSLPKQVNVELISTRSISTSYILSKFFDEQSNVKKNTKTMNSIFKKIYSCKISTSVKEGQFGKVKVKKGDFIGISEKKIVSSNVDLLTVVKQTINSSLGSSKNFEECIIFTGDGSNAEVTSALTNFLKTKKIKNIKFLDSDIPNYSYTISIY